MDKILPIAQYKTSKDYTKLANLARSQNVICILDYLHPRMPVSSREVAMTMYSDNQANHKDYFQVGVRGCSFLTAFNVDDFVSLCIATNLEFIDPE